MSTEVPYVSPYVCVDSEKIVQVIGTALKAKESGSSFLVGLEPPEKRFIELITEYARANHEPEFILNALLMVTTLMFLQETYGQFNRITGTYPFDEFAWLFKPRSVIEEFEAGVNIEAECNRYLRPAGIPVIALGQWVHNCRVLLNIYGGSMINYFEAHGNNPIQIRRAIFVKHRIKTIDKPEIRRLSHKLATLYLQWVIQYGLYDFSIPDIVQFGLPIDFQVCRVLGQIEGITNQKPTQVHRLTQRIVLPLLIELCYLYGWKPQEVSHVLWSIGNQGCRKRNHDGCPISSSCTKLISADPWYDKGVFDTTDIGRFKEP